MLNYTYQGAVKCEIHDINQVIDEINIEAHIFVTIQRCIFPEIGDDFHD